MGSPEIAKELENKARSRAQTKIETMQLGIYSVMVEKRMASLLDFDPAETSKMWRGGINVLYQLIKDIVIIAPSSILLLAFASTWESLEEVVLLALETRLLEIIEVGLTSKNGLDGRAVTMAVIARVLFAMCTSLVNRWSYASKARVKDRVVHHYSDFILAAKLKMDLPSILDNQSNDHLSADLPWRTFSTLLDLGATLFAVITQISLMFHIVRSGNHGFVFAILCIAKPLIRAFGQKTMWSMPRVVEATDKDYLRMNSLRSLQDNKFRLDILSGNLVEYIIAEFRKARAGLGETSTDYAESQYSSKQSPIAELVASFVGDFPLVYYAAISLFSPSSMSLSAIASLQKSAIVLRWMFWDIFYRAHNLRENISRVQHLYDLEKKVQRIKDGDLPYPSEKESDKGMAFDLRNISFSYPGSKDGTKALSDVSFRIDPGELVVIVGANGSGKSTFVKLLTRLYDVNDGTVLVDGEDIRQYKLSELRQSIATLTQDHVLFPLTIEENIGLGYPEALTDEVLIEKAARLGGASELLGKLNNGMKTILDPYSVQYGANLGDDEDSELSQHLKKLKKKAEVSGGERQRLMASRTFMRFNSNKIKFVAVDEPSSALDPEGELELFNNLREARAGKTMIFVTHRFGHLTKHADKILCMKEGKVVESGTHTELMALGGEYCKMYEVQAKAFEK